MIRWALTSSPRGFVVSSIVRITSICPLPKMLPDHALEAHDIERAAALIEDIGLSVMLPGQVFTLLGWLDKLSDAVVRWRPTLCIVHAAALMFAGQPEAAETRLDDAERDVQADAPADQILILGQAASIRGNLAASLATSRAAWLFRDRHWTYCPRRTSPGKCPSSMRPTPTRRAARRHPPRNASWQ